METSWPDTMAHKCGEYGHTSKRTHAPCGEWVIPGKTACYYHGGMSLSGQDSPSFTNGKYSTHLPSRLAAAYQEALADPDIHSIMHEAALLEARLKELAARLATSDLGHAWVSLASAWREFTKRRSTGDVAGMQEALDTFGGIVAHGQQDYLLWQEILTTSALLAKLRLQEHKRLVDLQNMMSSEKVLTLFGLIQSVVREAILTYADPEVAKEQLKYIQQGLSRVDTRLLGEVRLKEVSHG